MICRHKMRRTAWRSRAMIIGLIASCVQSSKETWRSRALMVVLIESMIIPNPEL